MIGAAPVLVSFYNASMDKDADYNRLCWHSRRGMLELDLVLGPFLDACYPGLDGSDRRRFQQLMLCEDPELLAWFLQRQRPADEELLSIVKQILEFSGDRPDDQALST